MLVSLSYPYVELFEATLTSCISTVIVSPAFTGHLLPTGDVPALHRMELPETSVTGLLFIGRRAHWVPCDLLARQITTFYCLRYAYHIGPIDPKLLERSMASNLGDGKRREDCSDCRFHLAKSVDVSARGNDLRISR